MAVNATELIGKLNFVTSSRLYKQKNYIEEYPNLPANLAEEEQIVRNMMFSFIKKLFVGCKIRPNANSFSLRLDGQVHRKANKIRDIYNNDSEWRTWFERNHQNLFRTMRTNRQSFNSSNLVHRNQVEGKIFLSIPFTPSRIYGYATNGLVDFTEWLEREYQKDLDLFNIYDEVTSLIEAEIERKEWERRERIERELREYKESIFRNLFKPISPLEESEDAIDRLFAHKFREWAREQGVAPEYTLTPTAVEMIPTGLKVKIMAPPNSEEEGWIALPPFEGYEEPADFEMQGWGKVTSIDMTSERSRQGQAPVVVQEYLYTEFHLEHWKHLLPENHAEILEASTRLRREAEAEIEPWLEQERIRKEREEAERIAAEEERKRVLEEQRRQAEEIARAEAEAEAARLLQVEEEEAEQARLEEVRRRELAEQLRRQLASQTVEQPQVQVEEVVPFAPAEPTPEPERATEEGLYRNSMAIPLERYVAINGEGQTRRFTNPERAAEWLGYSGEIVIYDYHVPHNEVEEFYVDEEEDYPF